MNSKFDTLYESNFSRYQGGGFLTGDIIKFKDQWEQDEWCKSAPNQVIEKIRELIGSDLTLRVSSVKALRPAVNSSVDQSSSVDDFHVDIAQELAPGRFNGVFITVPQHLIELNGANDSLPEIPDSLKRDDKVDVKPTEIKKEDITEPESDLMTDPGVQTGTNDKYNKSLTTSNHKLPGSTAANSYTSKYMQ